METAQTLLRLEILLMNDASEEKTWACPQLQHPSTRDDMTTLGQLCLEQLLDPKAKSWTLILFHLPSPLQRSSQLHSFNINIASLCLHRLRPCLHKNWGLHRCNRTHLPFSTNRVFQHRHGLVSLLVPKWVSFLNLDLRGGRPCSHQSVHCNNHHLLS